MVPHHIQSSHVQLLLMLLDLVEELDNTYTRNIIINVIIVAKYILTSNIYLETFFIFTNLPSLQGGGHSDNDLRV